MAKKCHDGARRQRGAGRCRDQLHYKGDIYLDLAGDRRLSSGAPSRNRSEMAGVEAHLAEPADTASLRGKKRRAKTDRADARHLRELLAGGRLPES
jgi:hypothetical protein